MKKIHIFILNFKLIQRTSFWYWYRLMIHYGLHFDDRNSYQNFWHSINSGFHDMNYKWEFEKLWGKGAKPETIYLSQKDYDSLVEQLNRPPKFNQKIYDLMNRKSPWED